MDSCGLSHYDDEYSMWYWLFTIFCTAIVCMEKRIGWEHTHSSLCIFALFNLCKMCVCCREKPVFIWTFHSAALVNTVSFRSKFISLSRASNVFLPDTCVCCQTTSVYLSWRKNVLQNTLTYYALSAFDYWLLHFFFNLPFLTDDIFLLLTPVY